MSRSFISTSALLWESTALSKVRQWMLCSDKNFYCFKPLPKSAIHDIWRALSFCNGSIQSHCVGWESQEHSSAPAPRLNLIPDNCITVPRSSVLYTTTVPLPLIFQKTTIRISAPRHQLDHTYSWASNSNLDSNHKLNRESGTVRLGLILHRVMHLEENPVINFSCGSLYITRFRPSTRGESGWLARLWGLL